MNKRRLFSALLSVMIIISSLSGCLEEKKILKYNLPKEFSCVYSDIISENSNYKLSWDSEYACVLLENKESGTVWSTVPYDFYSEGDTNSSLCSPVYIQYYNPSDGGLESSKAYTDCISEGYYSAEKIENGIKLKLYFIDAEITIPIKYTLREDSLEVSVPLAEIFESGKTKLIELSLLPYLCSVRNTESKNDYVMLPVGSGALAYTDEEKTDISRTFMGDVYGVDYGSQRLDNKVEEERISLPVFGAKSGDNALFAIIEEGSGSARLDADIGNYRNGYSTAYSTFQVRSFDEVETEKNNYSDERVYADEFDKNLDLKIGFYPLSGEKANYSGMAECYRKYLNIDDAEKNEQNSLRLELLGGSLTRHFILGIPYFSLTKATSFDEAQKIIGDVIKNTSEKPAVTLKGFGNDGNSIGQVAGAYSYSSALGGDSGHESIESYCKKNNIPVFTNYEVMLFNDWSFGFSTFYDVAKTASKQKAAQYPLTLNLRAKDKDSEKVYLMKRDKINQAIDKLISSTDKNTSGISLSSLGVIAYSDYSSSKYASKGSLDEITRYINKVKKSGHKVSVSGANDYAATAADVITDVSLTNGNYRALDAAIPFYQLVFSSKALYSQPLNSHYDINKAILRAVESGVSPTFSVCNNYDTDFSELGDNSYYSSVYSGVKGDIVSVSQSTSKFYKAISGAKILSHEIISDGVTRSVFSNGVSVIVNHTDSDVDVNGKTVGANSFSYTDAGEVESE